jgi:hypothetical protein
MGLLQKSVNTYLNKHEVSENTATQPHTLQRSKRLCLDFEKEEESTVSNDISIQKEYCAPKNQIDKINVKLVGIKFSKNLPFNIVESKEF